MRLVTAHLKCAAAVLCALASLFFGIVSKLSAEVHLTARFYQTIPSDPCPGVLVPDTNSLPIPPEACPPMVLLSGAGLFTLGSNRLAFYIILPDVEWQVLIRKPSGQEIPIAICPMYELVPIPSADPGSTEPPSSDVTDSVVETINSIGGPAETEGRPINLQDSDTETPPADLFVRVGCKPSGVLDLSETDIIELLAGLWSVETRLITFDPVNPSLPVFAGRILPDDTDADGVPDFRDACGNTPVGVVINGDGCSVEQLSPCAGPWRNHGEYMNRMRLVIASFLDQGLIRPTAAQTLMRDAANSNCGRPSLPR